MRDRECVALLQWALPRLGLRWPGFRRVRRQVCKRISRRMTELGIPDAAAYRRRLEADPAEWAALDACCWISISRFYRDRRVFEDLIRVILPALARAAISQGRHLVRAWSAGCGSGEEPYSLRLAWDLAVAPAFPEAQLQIVATDASAELLERARRASYPASSLEELPTPWRPRAFERLDGAYRLRDEFRRGIEFHRQDIRKAMPGGRFDLILCRNLAFTYFDLELQHAIQRRLTQRLIPGGALLIGAHESLPEPAALAPSGETRGLYRAANCQGAPLPGREKENRSCCAPEDRDLAYEIQRAGYFHATVRDSPGEAYKLLSQLADLGVNLVAFTAVPVGPLHTQLTIFPEAPLKLQSEARRAGLALDGPHPALLVQGEDEIGALARIHERLDAAGVNVYASSGVTDGRGSFGYVIYVRPEEFERAADALGA